jgi:hypothetical protein
MMWRRTRKEIMRKESERERNGERKVETLQRNPGAKFKGEEFCDEGLGDMYLEEEKDNEETGTGRLMKLETLSSKVGTFLNTFFIGFCFTPWFFGIIQAWNPLRKIILSDRKIIYGSSMNVTVKFEMSRSRFVILNS